MFQWIVYYALLLINVSKIRPDMLCNRILRLSTYRVKPTCRLLMMSGSALRVRVKRSFGLTYILLNKTWAQVGWVEYSLIWGWPNWNISQIGAKASRRDGATRAPTTNKSLWVTWMCRTRFRLWLWLGWAVVFTHSRHIYQLWAWGEKIWICSLSRFMYFDRHCLTLSGAMIVWKLLLLLWHVCQPSISHLWWGLLGRNSITPMIFDLLFSFNDPCATLSRQHTISNPTNKVLLLSTNCTKFSLNVCPKMSSKHFQTTMNFHR